MTLPTSAHLLRTEPVGPLSVLEERVPGPFPARPGGWETHPGLGMLVEVTDAEEGC